MLKDMLKDILHWDLTGRITWAVLLWIFFHLLWFKFVESYIPVWVGGIIITLLCVAFVIFGPRPIMDGEGEEEGKEGDSRG